MSPSHHRAVEVAAEFLRLYPMRIQAQWTWGPTVVVEATFSSDLTVFVKAGADQNVHTEAAVIDRVRRSGVPAVEVLGVGTDGQLPGGRWMIMRAAPGRTLQEVGRQAPTIGRTLDDLAECYTRLHRVELPGYGPVAVDGQRGELGSWSQWQQQTASEALAALNARDAVSAGFVTRVRELSKAFADDLDRKPGVLLHADLGDRETFVDPETGAVTAIVDWGGALVGDPLYDLVRFVGGGPADDERPGQLLPTLHARYFERNPHALEDAQRMLTFYRFHICVMEAAWGEELGWTTGHLAWVERLIDQLQGEPGGAC